MKVKQVMNDYLLIEESEQEKEKKVGSFYLPESSDDPDTVKKATVLMIPEDFDSEGSGIKAGSHIAFYKGTAIPVGNHAIIHIQNILGAYIDE